MKTIIEKMNLCLPSVKLLGDYWTLRIIDVLSRGESRFCTIERRLDNINPVTLTNRLKKLEEANIITRSQATIDKLSVTYRLSDLGFNSLPIIKAYNDFAEKANLNS